MTWSAYALEQEVEGGREVHLLVCAEVKAPTGPRPPLWVNLVLDRSGSMTGAPLAAARDAAAQIVSECGPDDHLGLVVFDGIVEERVPVGPMDEPGRARMLGALSELDPGRGTHLHQAIREGMSGLTRRLVPGRKPRLVVLTDGEPSVGPTSVESFRNLGEDIAAHGVALHAIGLGAHYLPDILSALSRPSGNAFGHADGAEGLPAVMGGVFSLLFGEAAPEVSVRVTPSGLDSLELRHRFPTEVDDRSMWVKLGGIVHGQPRRVLLTARPITPSWDFEVTSVSVEGGDRRHRPVELHRVWPDSTAGRLIRSIGYELQLLQEETRAWQLVLAGDPRARLFLERAERWFRNLLVLDCMEIDRRRHFERLGDLRLAVEQGKGDAELLSRRAQAAHETTGVSQIIPFSQLKGRA